MVAGSSRKALTHSLGRSLSLALPLAAACLLDDGDGGGGLVTQQKDEDDLTSNSSWSNHWCESQRKRRYSNVHDG